MRTLAVMALVLASVATAAAEEADLKFLHAEVRSVGFMGAPGGVAVFGEKAFPVVVDESRASVPVVAAARLGKGRVVYLGHESFVTFAAPPGDTARFVQNFLLWAAGAEQGQGKVAVLARGAPALAKLVPAERFAVSGLKEKEALPPNATRTVIVIGNPGSVSRELAQSLQKYVEGGGGLVFGIPGWGWQQVNPGKRLSGDFPLNEVLQAAGMAVTDRVIQAGKEGTLRVQAPPRFSHSREAVAESVRLRKEGAAPPAAQAEVIRAATGRLEFAGDVAEVKELRASLTAPPATPPAAPAVDAKKIVGIWNTTADKNQPTWTFTKEGSVSFGVFAGTYEVEKNKLVIKLPTSSGFLERPYEVVKLTDTDLELRAPGAKDAHAFKKAVVPEEVKKLVGIWKAVDDGGSGFTYTFNENGSYLMQARLADGQLASFPGTFKVEKGKLIFDSKTSSTYDIVKLTDTELETRKPGDKASQAYKRFVPADNPDYTSWSRFPKGTRVTIRYTSTSPRGAVVRTETKTVLDVTPTEVVIEYEYVANQTEAGQKDVEVGRLKPRKDSIPKAAPIGVKVVDHTKKPEGATGEGGFETLKVGGAEIKAKWYEFELPVAKGQPAEVSKRWYSEEVPGVIMRFEHRVGGKVTQLWEVVGVKKP